MIKRVYRQALYLLPSDLRRKHGAAMETLFAAELQRARQRGRVNVPIAAAIGIWDVVQRSTYELVRTMTSQLEHENVQLPTPRELLGRHARSFGIALVVLTAILFVQYASRQVPSLHERGLSSANVAQAMLYSLPFMLAMTIPMSVLVSVLYEFTRLGAKGTLAAAELVRGGVRHLVAPVIMCAIGMTVLAYVVTAEIVPRANERLASAMAGHVIEPGDRSLTIGALRNAANISEQSNDPVIRERVRSYNVEIQKKIALPVACLLLALAGMALAFRIPRGGMVLAIAGSLTVFGIYYALIMTGETLADRLIVSPFVGMWTANGFVLMIAMLAVVRRRGSAAIA